MKKIKYIFLILSIGCASILPSAAYAASAKSQIQCGVNVAAGSSDCTATPSTSVDSVIKFVLNLLSTVAGVAAVAMIIIAGIKYTSSAGNADRIKSAKSTLIYAIVGLALVALTQTIVHLVLTEAANPTSLGANSNPSAPSAVSPGAANSHH